MREINDMKNTQNRDKQKSSKAYRNLESLIKKPTMIESLANYKDKHITTEIYDELAKDTASHFKDDGLANTNERKVITTFLMNNQEEMESNRHLLDWNKAAAGDGIPGVIFSKIPLA
jgi:hypothetical protein